MSEPIKIQHIVDSPLGERLIADRGRIEPDDIGLVVMQEMTLEEFRKRYPDADL